MSLLSEKTLTPEDEELELKRARLAELEALLADRELELASFLAELVHFEKHYLRTVGRRYAILDELKARIAEARARNNPQSKEDQNQAKRARSQARESARAAGEKNGDQSSVDEASSPPKPRRSESLDKLYRQAAKLLHPDLTVDPEERKRRHRVMAELNAAYAQGDDERIRAVLREWHASPENVQGDGAGAELIRIIRKIAQVEKRLVGIAAELGQHRQGELSKLKQQVEESSSEGRDKLKELAEQLDASISESRDDLRRILNEAAR